MKNSMIKGKIHKYSDNIDTDVIIPGRFCNLTDPKLLAPHCLEDLDVNFVKKVKPGDIILAGDNFGCGSSREIAAVTIKAAGISAVIAKSFARIFYRNAINIGLPIITSPETYEYTSSNDIVEVNLFDGEIINHTAKKEFTFIAFPSELADIFDAGGLIPWLNKIESNSQKKI